MNEGKKDSKAKRARSDEDLDSEVRKKQKVDNKAQENNDNATIGKPQDNIETDEEPKSPIVYVDPPGQEEEALRAPLPAFNEDTRVVKVDLKVKLKGAILLLAPATCVIEGEEVKFSDLCTEWDIQMRNGPLDLTNLRLLPWADQSLRNELKFAVNLIPSLVQEIFDFDPEKSHEADCLQAVRQMITQQIAADSNGEKITIKNLLKAIPDVITLVGSWSRKDEVSALASAQDFTTRVYSQLFEPFFSKLNHTSCAAMPLPPPFEKLKRLPDMRAYVAQQETEFTYFIREDSPLKQGHHKELHKIVQLMRCALRLLVLHMKPSNEQRTFYCFGYLNSGYKMQLLQMSVELNSEADYVSPIYTLLVDGELDLTELNAGALETLMTQLVAIRLYGHHLDHLLNAWELVKKPHPHQTSQKRAIAKSSARAGSKESSMADDHAELKERPFKYDKDDHDAGPPDNSGSRSNQPRGQEQRQQASQSSPTFRKSGGSTQNNNEEKLDSVTLDVIVRAVKSNECCLLQENKKYHKRVLLVCTTVKRLRLFVVKEYSLDCARKNMDEIEILKLLGDHPNICQLLATTQLYTGETLMVQEFHENDRKIFYAKDKLPLVFAELAKGLAHIHKCGVIHGDIKPGNFLVDEEYDTRIIDFDFSVRVGIDNVKILGGTDGYLAPERYRHYVEQTGQISFKSDIWSLAITVFHYAGIDFGEVVDPLERRKIILQQINSKEPKVEFLTPIHALLQSMLSIRPDDRPTAVEVRAKIVASFNLPIGVEEEVTVKGIEEAQDPRASKTTKTPHKYVTFADENNENGASATKKRVGSGTSRKEVLVDVTNLVK